jgi:hypothetical protein
MLLPLRRNCFSLRGNQGSLRCPNLPTPISLDVGVGEASLAVKGLSLRVTALDAINPRHNRRIPFNAHIKV